MEGLDSRGTAGETNGNELVTFRLIPAFKKFRRTVSRVCGAFVAYLFCPFRATDVRLPRAALCGCAASLCPGLTCFAPSGHGWFSTLGGFTSWDGSSTLSGSLFDASRLLLGSALRQDGLHVPISFDLNHRFATRIQRLAGRAAYGAPLNGKSRCYRSVAFRNAPNHNRNICRAPRIARHRRSTVMGRRIKGGRVKG
jgi:hypothetical protein